MTKFVLAACKGGNMAQGSGFQGTYKVTAKNPAEVKPGDWYYGFDCLVCGRRFAVFDDTTSATKPVTFAGGGVFRVACPHCSADRMYQTDQVQHFQAT